MNPKKTPIFEAVCPSCAAIRRCRTVGTATINGRTARVIECPDPSCELQWCPPRPRFAPANAA